MRIVKLIAIPFFLIILFFFSCSKDHKDNPSNGDPGMYFPPINSGTWESITPESLSWNTAYLDELYDYLSANGTRAFIILKNGKRIYNGSNNVYWSIPRDMARFGLLILNKGKWGNEYILTDSLYFNAMVNTSQELNLSYGYLWWLNGKGSVIFPGLVLPLNIDFAPDAPDDMIVAAGKNGQYIDVVPGINLVIVRMGEAPDGSQVPVQFHNEIWKIINRIIN